MGNNRVSKQEWGVRLSGEVERISDAAANEGYRTAVEYAERRAAATGGTVVTRTVVVTTSKWKELSK